MTPRADVLILGSGPSAAYAVLACEDAGMSCEVMSNRGPNVSQVGAFFLHWVPDRLEAKPTKVQVWGVGTREGYLTKQWGPEFRGIPTSFPSEERMEKWYPSSALSRVWEQVSYHRGAVAGDADLAKLGGQYGRVFHTFSSQRSGTSRRLQMFPTLSRQQREERDYGSNLVIYNGDPAEAHIRVTVAWGRLSVEFPRGTPQGEVRGYRRQFRGEPDTVMLRDILPTTAPVSREERVADNVIPLGRFATWDRRALSHHAYQGVLDALKETVR